MRPAETECVFLDGQVRFGSFRRFRRVLTQSRLIHMSTDTSIRMRRPINGLYLHKSIIFLAIILILKHVLLRLMQKYLSLIFRCLLCCMNWYSCGFIRSSHRIGTRLCRIRIVVKFYNHTFCYGTDAARCGIIFLWCSLNENTY